MAGRFDAILLIRLVGDFAPGQVRVNWVPSTRRSFPDVEPLIESAWAAAKARLGERLFDGPMCRLEAATAEAGRLRLDISPITYKPFLGTNLSHPALAESHGPAALANPLGVSSALESADGWLLLGRRGDGVAYYPRRVHPFAGCLEPRTPLDVFAEMRRELGEELSLAESDLAELRCIGLVEDRKIHQPEMIFIARTHKTRAEVEAALDAAEHTATFAIPADADAVAGAIRDDLLTPVGVGAMLLFGRRCFGDGWFGQNR
jgi:hypothetical protein